MNFYVIKFWMLFFWHAHGVCVSQGLWLKALCVVCTVSNNQEMAMNGLLLLMAELRGQQYWTAQHYILHQNAERVATSWALQLFFTPGSSLQNRLFRPVLWVYWGPMDKTSERIRSFLESKLYFKSSLCRYNNTTQPSHTCTDWDNSI